jgi:hypothetical protein
MTEKQTKDLTEKLENLYNKTAELSLAYEMLKKENTFLKELLLKK